MTYVDDTYLLFLNLDWEKLRQKSIKHFYSHKLINNKKRSLKFNKTMVFSIN